jgi:hypothetical protein
MTELNAGRISGLKAWLLMGCCGLFLADWGSASAQAPAPHAPEAGATNASIAPKTAHTATPTPSSAWRQLTPMQRQALAPLGAQWSALTVQQQNKWLAISKNFMQLPVADQITMHSRMADWVDLKPQQRNLARLNFNPLQSLPKEDRKAKWEAYQALSEEEKRLLHAGGTPSPTKSAALTAKPLEPHRKVQTRVQTAEGKTPPPAAIDRKTLLPLPVTLTAPTHTVPAAAPTEMPESIKPPTETAPS